MQLDNVLLHGRGERPVVKICDFGYSKDEVAGSICKTACGTPEYVAPEVLVSNQYSGRAADIWSAGVILYVMLTGRQPSLYMSSPQSHSTRMTTFWGVMFPTGRLLGLRGLATARSFALQMLHTLFTTPLPPWSLQRPFCLHRCKPS